MFTLHAIDWLIIGLYVALALGVGLAFKRRAGRNRASYFLAGRALPWWWVGASMAATTFAADTPLAVTGIIADKGLSGNWLWIPVIGVHAGVFVLFAANWNRSGVITDAELIRLRYSGRTAYALRWCRAGLQLVQNCVVLGWVLRAMVKVASPFFQWHEWFPGFMAGIKAVWPGGTALGTASEGLTIIVLLLVVGCYSSLGGLRGVVLTDLVQLALALLGSTWLAVCAWRAVGGRDGLLGGLAALYGPGHAYLDWFPTPGSGWLGAVGVGAGVFGLYLVVQSFSNMSADGGGYFMQRLNAARSPDAARRAALLFLVIHYMVRVWPWFIVGLTALVLIPIGQETASLNGGGSPGRRGPGNGLADSHGIPARPRLAGYRADQPAGRLHEHRGYPHQLGRLVLGQRRLAGAASGGLGPRTDAGGQECGVPVRAAGDSGERPDRYDCGGMEVDGDPGRGAGSADAVALAVVAGERRR